MEERMILLDTSFLIAKNNEKDMHHTRAIELSEKIAKGEYGEIYITEYIFGECATVLLNKLKNKKETEIKCTQIKEIETIHIENETFEETWKIFCRQKDFLSFIDCSSIAIMRTQYISYIATFDSNFEDIQGIKVIR